MTTRLISKETLLSMISRMNTGIPTNKLHAMDIDALMHIASDTKDLSMLTIDVIKIIVPLLDDKSFCRLVAVFPTLARDVHTNKEWYVRIFAKNNMLFERHHTMDKPVNSNGKTTYYKYGKFHRDDNDLPAVFDKTKHQWWQNGKICRPNGNYNDIGIHGEYVVYKWLSQPINPDPNYNFEYHRTDDLPSKIICTLGRSTDVKDYYEIDESTIVAKMYIANGLIGRENGPTIEFADKKYVDLWFLNDKRLSHPDHKEILNNNCYAKWTDDKLRELLKYVNTINIKASLERLEKEYPHYAILNNTNF